MRKPCLSELSPLHTIYRCIYSLLRVQLYKDSCSRGRRKISDKMECRIRNVTVGMQIVEWLRARTLVLIPAGGPLLHVTPPSPSHFL